jgi:hypothetical protein
MVRSREENLARRAIGAWDTAAKLTFPYYVQGSHGVLDSQLLLGADGAIYAFRGMTEREWNRGVVAPEHAYASGGTLHHQHQYAEVQQGFANPVARYGLELDD